MLQALICLSKMDNAVLVFDKEMIARDEHHHPYKTKNVLYVPITLLQVISPLICLGDFN